MKFTNLTSLFLLVAPIITTALPAPSPAPQFRPPNPANQVGIPNGAGCQYALDSIVIFSFNLRVWGPWQQDDYGKGFLDNLRGECGIIMGWEFFYYADGSATATFDVFTSIRQGCVEDAVRLASGASGSVQGLQCQQVESSVINS